jgi:hypothetical protein
MRKDANPLVQFGLAADAMNWTGEADRRDTADSLQHAGFAQAVM